MGTTETHDLIQIGPPSWDSSFLLRMVSALWVGTPWGQGRLSHFHFRGEIFALTNGNYRRTHHKPVSTNFVHVHHTPSHSNNFVHVHHTPSHSDNFIHVHQTPSHADGRGLQRGLSRLLETRDRPTPHLREPGYRRGAWKREAPPPSKAALARQRSRAGRRLRQPRQRARRGLFARRAWGEDRPRCHEARAQARARRLVRQPPSPGARMHHACERARGGCSQGCCEVARAACESVRV